MLLPDTNHNITLLKYDTKKIYSGGGGTQNFNIAYYKYGYVGNL